MKRRYGTLFAVILALAVLLARVRAPHVRAHRAVRDAAPVPADSIALVVNGESVSPSYTAATKGAVVYLSIRCQSAGAPVHLVLAGYESRLTVPALAAGSTWNGSFVADLPGDHFAWFVNGKPAARFAVTGAHLVEGH